ncbi:MAG: DUF5683 domain-containing protein, partial [Candidatus Cloacimonadota bacterium]|nr:DUF5683 domain-containing protein [Candidatus Cloacimonadota bacterium]
MVSDSSNAPDSILFAPARIPSKAMLLSAFLPGGGQFYNHKPLKASLYITLESSLLGFGIYYAVKTNQAFDDYQQTQNQSDYNEYVNYNDKSQNMIWWFATVKFISIVDAYVDAKLYNFDWKKRKIDLRFEK